MTIRPPACPKPLNPLSPHALHELREIAFKPLPRCAVNPGVVDRLLRERLAEIVQMASPFKVHDGRMLDHLKITRAGRDRLKDAS